MNNLLVLSNDDYTALLNMIAVSGGGESAVVLKKTALEPMADDREISVDELVERLKNVAGEIDNGGDADVHLDLVDNSAHYFLSQADELLSRAGQGSPVPFFSDLSTTPITPGASSVRLGGNTDWDMLQQQHAALAELLSKPGEPSDHELWGLVHLIEHLLDEAAGLGIWSYPEK